MGLILEAKLPDPLGPCPWHQHWPGASEGTRNTGWGLVMEEGGRQQQLYLDGGPSKPGQLFNVRPLLPDDGTYSLGWDEEIHGLLLWILEGQHKMRRHSHWDGSFRHSATTEHLPQAICCEGPNAQGIGQNGARGSLRSRALRA